MAVAPAPVRPPAARVSAPGRSGHTRPDLAVAALASRLIRRGALGMIVALAAYAALEVTTYIHAYPDAASSQQLVSLATNPALGMLEGMPHAIDTPGGFVAWDAGWAMVSMTAIWAVLTTGRLTRGEEETGRAEVMLTTPLRAGRAVLTQCLVISAVCLLIGAAVAIVLVLAGTGATGSVLFGLGIACFGALFGAIAAVTSQVFEVRRRATGAAAAALGVFYLIRMAANSDDSRGWLRWLTPYGWMDNLAPYGGPRQIALLPLLLAPVVLFALAVWLRTRRDTGSALIVEADQREASPRLLGGPVAFAWRSTRGLVVGWLVALAVSAAAFGSFTKPIVDFLATSTGKVFTALGGTPQTAAQSYLALMGQLVGLLLALFVCFRIAAARTEEASERLEHTLTKPVPRARWFGGEVALSFGALVCLAAVAGVTTGIGAIAGGANVAMGDAMASVLNTVPAALLFGGIAVLVFGLWPRLTTIVPATLAVIAYIVELIGSSLDWPTWVLDLSPFHQIAAVPAQSFQTTSAVVMIVLTAVLTAIAIAVFRIRDLTGD